jgi:hypothetical protein
MNIPIYYTDIGKFILTHMERTCSKCIISNICGDPLLKGIYFNNSIACINLYCKIDNRSYKSTFKLGRTTIVYASLFIISYEKKYGSGTSY